MIFLATTLVSAENITITKVWTDKPKYEVGEEVTVYAKVINPDSTPFIATPGKSRVAFTFTNVEGEWKELIPFTDMKYDEEGKYYVGRAKAPELENVRILVDAITWDPYYSTRHYTTTFQTYTMQPVEEEMQEQEETAYPEHCYNAILDGDEEGVDCGGSCVPCGITKEVYIADVWTDKPYYEPGEKVKVYAKVVDHKGPTIAATPEEGYSVEFGAWDFSGNRIPIVFTVKFNEETGYWEAETTAPEISPVRILVNVVESATREVIASNKEFYFKVLGVETVRPIEKVEEIPPLKPIKRPTSAWERCELERIKCEVAVLKRLGYTVLDYSIGTWTIAETLTPKEHAKIREAFEEEGCYEIYQKCREANCVPKETFEKCIEELKEEEVIDERIYNIKCGIPCPVRRTVAAVITEADADYIIEDCVAPIIEKYYGESELRRAEDILEECNRKMPEEFKKEQAKGEYASSVKYILSCLAENYPERSAEIKNCIYVRGRLREVERKRVEKTEIKIPEPQRKAKEFLDCIGKVIKRRLSEEEIKELGRKGELICEEWSKSLGTAVSCTVRLLNDYPEVKKEALKECAPYFAEKREIIERATGIETPKEYEIGKIFCQGCRRDGQCLPYGTRIKMKPAAKIECYITETGEKVCKEVATEEKIKETPMYCDIDGSFKPQKEEGSECQNNWECLSNECGDGKCISTYGLLKKILMWLKKLFGFGE